jgi:hypothetical protein
LRFGFVAIPGFVKLESAFGVVRGASLDGGKLSGLVLIVEFFEIWNAPAASGSRSETLRD